MNRSKLPLILALAVAVIVAGVLLFLHFRLPEENVPTPPASSASQSEQLPAPWVAGGDVITRIG